MASTRGRLLVASPELGDPNFERTVVLVLEHDHDGALGVVLNRPSDTPVLEVLEGLAVPLAHPPVVHRGGPVSPTAVICLARVVGRAVGLAPVLGAVGVFDLEQHRSAPSPEVEDTRIFAGYAGWGPGQLEGELDEGAWFVVDARESDVLTPEPQALWRAVLRRQRGPLAKFALYPPSPTLN